MKFASERGLNQGAARRLGRRTFGLGLLAAWMLRPAATFAVQTKAPTAFGNVLPFDTGTWASLLSHGPRPAAYVFTTTYCSTCAEVFELLHQSIVAAHKPVVLAAVVMDETGARALKHAHHYQGISRLYAFDGFEPEIRQTVDPKWRNITPYVVLVGRSGALQRSLGPPAPAMLKAWLA